MLLSALIGTLVVGMFVLGPSMPARADVDMYDGRWHFTIAPYLWLPTVNGALGFNVPTPPGGGLGLLPPPGTTVGVTITPSSLFSNLNFAFLGYFEARKSNWSIFTDVIYLNLGAHDSAVTTINLGQGPININPSFNVSTNSSFETFLDTLGVSYTLLRVGGSTLDVFGGGQYISASGTVNWSLVGPLGLFPKSGTLNRSQGVIAGVAGIKGTIQLPGRWFVPYYADGGAGGFSTWQAMAGIGYAYHWGDVTLTYRYLYVDMSSGGLLQNTSLSGPMLGVVWHL